MVQDPKKWNLGIAKLSAIMMHCPSPVDEDHVKEFHDIVALLEEAAGEDFSLFKISPDKLAPKLLSRIRGDYGGRSPGSLAYSTKKYCDDRFFRAQVHGLSNYVMILQSNSTKPANPYELLTDDKLKEMLLERGIKPKRPNGTYGYDRANAIAQLVEREKPPAPAGPRHSTVINVHAGQGSNLNLNSPGASITQTTNYKSDDFRELIVKLKDLAVAKDLSHDDRDLINVNIGTIEVQINSPRPNGTIIKECLRSAKSILENAAGTLVASVLTSQIIPHIARYLQ